MPPSLLNPLTSELAKLSDVLKGKSQQTRSTTNPIRKRHWFLGSAVILVGSWITHTTTATITEINPIPNAALQNVGMEVVADVIDSQALLSMAVYASTNAAHNTVTNVVAPESLEDLEDLEVLESLESPLTSRHRVIKKGESLGSIFRKEGLGYALPHKISEHPVANQLASISAGKAFEFLFDENEQLRKIHYPINSLQQLVVDIENDDIVAAEIEDLKYVTKQHTVSGEIKSSLYEAALDAGLSTNLTLEMVRIFGWDIDFVQDIRAGDTFHVIYTDYQVDDARVSDGDILAAEFTTQGQRYRAIRFEDDEGNVSFYTPEGESMLGTFLRSPVEFSRISSRFGRRLHPISKKWKTHKGVDYAASRGTPIRATADGKVVHLGRKGGYGKTIVLRHAGRFTTLYAHMNGYAKNIKSGARVKQGQTIGYVGSTGYSTGPHLHYEFRVDGVHRDSLTYKTPKASSISKNLREEFTAVANNWGQKLDAVQKDYILAKAQTGLKTKKI